MFKIAVKYNELWHSRVSFFIPFVINTLLIGNYSYANDDKSTLANDSLAKYVALQLKKADKIKNKDLQEALLITEQLLKDSSRYKNDSISNYIKYRHSLYLLMLDENVSCKKMIYEILSYYEQKEPKKWTALKSRLGSIEIRFGHYDEAIRHLEEALPYAKKLRMKISEGLIYLYLSDIYRLKSDYGNAYKNADIALQLFREIGRIDWISTSLSTLAYICILAKDFDGASAYFKEIFKDAERIDNKNFLVRPVLYSGILNFEKGNISTAKQQLEEGINKIDSLGNFPDLAIVYQYMTKIYIFEEDYAKARRYIEESIKFAEKSLNKRQECTGKLILVKLDSITNPRKNNLNEVEEIYQWALENEDNFLLKGSSNYLSSYYIKQGQYKRALEYKEVYANASEKKIAKDKLNEIAVLKEKGKFEQEARERELNEKRLALQLQTNEKIKNIMTAGIFLLLVMSSLLLYYYNQKTNAYTSLHLSNQELAKTEQDLELKNAELKKYIESNIQLEQFAHIASHDLRAPIITINSFAKLLDEKASDKLDQNEHTYLEYIRINGKQMYELINDLLEYSKVNSQKVIISQIDIHQLVRDLIEMLKNQSSERNIEINITHHLPIIHADKVKIKRVFQNLIGNSIKFSDPQKESKIDISFEELPDKWKFYVADNGIGIKDNGIDIFQPYAQLNRKAEYKGTGLGLSFCQKIIQQHGGEIAYKSTFGEGCKFYFTISKKAGK